MLCKRFMIGFSLLIMAMGCTMAPAEEKNGFDLSNASVPADEILGGGPPKDGIPAIDQPKFIPAKEAGFLDDEDRVLGLNRNGVAKAYPIAILNWHEIVNDKLGDEAVLVSFCPLCGTGIAYTPEDVPEAWSFGVSGLLSNSDLLLYDRQTESLWPQISGQAISGLLKGKELQNISLAHTTWVDWRKRHPDTLVLSRDTGYERDYTRDPYAGYTTSDGLYFPVRHRDPRYHPKERVIGLEQAGHHKAYPFSELAKTSGRITDKLGEQEITIIYEEEYQSGRILDAKGKEIPSITSFWFAWYAFHPETEVFQVR